MGEDRFREAAFQRGRLALRHVLEAKTQHDTMSCKTWKFIDPFPETKLFVLYGAIHIHVKAFGNLISPEGNLTCATRQPLLRLLVNPKLLHHHPPSPTVRIRIRIRIRERSGSGSVPVPDADSQAGSGSGSGSGFLKIAEVITHVPSHDDPSHDPEHGPAPKPQSMFSTRSTDPHPRRDSFLSCEYLQQRFLRPCPQP